MQRLLQSTCRRLLSEAWKPSVQARLIASELGTTGKLLIANRGEIACRVIATARRLGIPTVAVYSDADRDAHHVHLADEAFFIGPAPALQSYLNADAILAAARASGARALHPGYGFLSENEHFVRRCQAEGITFVGPPASAIAAMGNKSNSKDIMLKAGVACVPGYHGPALDEAGYAAEADRIGYPILIKAVLGGGGKGMKIARSKREFKEALRSAMREARAAFDDDAVLLERLITQPRHVEVQVLADAHGNCVYVFERDCSVQRRHQKVLEEAPAPGLTPEQQQDIGQAAVAAAQAVGYEGAGTVEFLMDAKTSDYFFMEMNTRLQVEHPISELISGLDLVEMQLRVAAGQRLPLSQQQLQARGHAVEVRVYSEQPEKGFLPGGGTVCHLRLPAGAVSFVNERHAPRWDAAVRVGDDIGVHYDPLIAKLITWGHDRADALHKMRAALGELHIAGLPTNVDFLRRVVEHPAFEAGGVTTGFIEAHPELLQPAPTSGEVVALAVVARALLQARQAQEEWRLVQGVAAGGAWGARDGFRLWKPQPLSVMVAVDQGASAQEITAMVVFNGPGVFRVQLPCGRALDLQAVELKGEHICAMVNDRRIEGTVAVHSSSQNEVMDVWVAGEHGHFVFRQQQWADQGVHTAAGAGNAVVAPMTSRVTKVLVSVGDTVKAGDPVAIVEAMKMELPLVAPRDAVVEQVLVIEGQTVHDADMLLTLCAEAQTEDKEVRSAAAAA